MKKIVLALAIVFALSSVAMASPLTDYSKGKAALDVTYRISPDFDANPGINGIGKLGEVAFDGDNNFEWSFTYGIGNNWALQYRQAASKGKLGLINEVGAEPQAYASEGASGDFLNVGLQAKTKVEEYNALYKLNKNISLFTGVVKAAPSVKANVNASIEGESFSGDLAIAGHDKNIWQFGLQAVAPFANKFTGYGITSFGKDYRNWEVGLGYQISKDVELNVNYRDFKVDDMTMVGLNVPAGEGQTIGDVTSDVRYKGLGFGITYKF